MRENNIVVYQEVLSLNRRQRIYHEFRYAWERTSKKQRIEWCKKSTTLFLNVTLRRGKGFFNTIKFLVNRTATESKDFGAAIYNKNGLLHLKNKKKEFSKKAREIYEDSKRFAAYILRVFKDKPNEAGPILFLGILGFFCGAGFDIGEKTWYDIDGGIPDLDWHLGELTGLSIMHHRSIVTHSIISAAILETVIYSSISAVNMVHSNLPKHHDSFWDNVISYNNWGKAFALGACSGIAYHLLIDGTLDGGGSYSGLPSMPQWGHQAIALSNAGAEAIDLNKKK